jgi:hypothetical protein
MSTYVATLQIAGRSDSRFECEAVPSVGDRIVVYPNASPARERVEAAVTAIEWHLSPGSVGKGSKATKPRASLFVIASELAPSGKRRPSVR